MGGYIHCIYLPEAAEHQQLLEPVQGRLPLADQRLLVAAAAVACAIAPRIGQLMVRTHTRTHTDTHTHTHTHTWHVYT